MRGSWRPNRTAIYWPPLLWPSALCLSHSPGLLNRRPRGPLCWLSLTHLISNCSGPQLIRGSKGPLHRAFSTTSYQQLLWTPTQSGAPRATSAGRWFSLQHLVSVLSGPKLTDFLSSLSYVIVQSSTQSSGASLRNGKFGRVKGQNTTVLYLKK